MTAQASNKQPVQEPEQNAGGVPFLPASVDASDELMSTLRHFHLGEPGAKATLGAISSDFLPASLNSFRDVSKVRYDYPLFLFPAETAGDGPLAKPLSRFLGDVVDGFAPGADSARILKDNLAWIERELCSKLQGTDGPIEAVPLVSDAAKALQKQLDLKGEHVERLQADLDQLVGAVEEGSCFLGYCRLAPIYLLLHTVRNKTAPRRGKFKQEIVELARGLKALLDVEKGKTAASRKSGAIKASIGAANSYFNAVSISRMLDHSQGSVAMPAARCKRIQAALDTLDAYQDNPVLIHCIHTDKLGKTLLVDVPDFTSESQSDPCAVAISAFDKEAKKLAAVFAAVRVARLEVMDGYKAAIHDPWFKSFGWEGFSQEELLLVPTIVAVDNANRVAREGLSSFSQLLSSGRPVQALVRVQAHSNPAAQEGEDSFESFRVELGYLGIAHRQAVVSQSSAARYDHLMAQYDLALGATRAGLHLISMSIKSSEGGVLDPWFVANAALEGRAHPFFRVDPEAGDDAASRMDFSSNPQAEHDWPMHNFNYIDAKGDTVGSELTFTFADYALLIPGLQGHFGMVPAGNNSDDLVPVAEWLNMPQDQANSSVPFVLAVDGEGVIQCLVVSRALVIACRDRRNYWRTLQELAGVRSRYVEIAVQAANEEAQAAAAAEIEAIRDEHADELETVRAETAGEAMGRLADALVGLDISATATAPTASAVPAPSAAPVEETAVEPQVAPEPEEEEEVSFDDPWIESILCTTCNDCTDLNPLMFVYNDDKQAYIADATAGTYAQLVESAEFCPANCIHPGKPLNADEPDLDDLIKRAEAYN
ncbi:D-alanyl-D-alanine carboxypeptidase [hydrothermal vent metagenome]|uniref:D-alanyl-D-alanine carboxypeptidase n=1 Tax=hydrothermal vent metagenome TaxID=652676 RepID=A0A3B1B7A9_9ZZZZ